MGAIGTTNAYATTQPIQGNPIGNAMNIVEQNAFRYREEEDAKAKEAKAAEEARQKGIAELAGDYDYDISGFSSIDDPVYNFAMEAKKNVADLQQRMLQNPNMSQMEIADYKRQIAKQDQSFKYLKQFPTLLKAKVDGISKGIADDKYYKSDLERLQNEIKNLETGKFKLNIDKNGNPKITVYEQDENGAYTKVIKETGLGDYVNSLNPRKNFDYLKSLDDATKGVEGKLTARQSGANITEKLELTPEIINSANSYADFILTDADNRSIMEEQFGVTGNDLRKKVVDDYLARVEQKDIQKLDSSIYATNVGAAKDKEKEARYKVVDIPDSFTDPSNSYKPAEGFKAVSISNPKSVDFIKGYTLPKLNSYTVTNIGGKEKILAEITYVDIKGSTLSKEDEKKVDDLRLILGNRNAPVEEKENAELELSRITKGAEIKTEIVVLDESDAYKLGINSDIKGGQEEMIEIAKEKGYSKKTDKEIWDEEFKKPRENKTPAKNKGTYDDL